MTSRNKFFDAQKQRLVYCHRAASTDFWDEHWESADFGKFLEEQNPFVLNATRAFLPAGAKVLEGGCGRGQNVHTLRAAGYDVYGVDFASKTVAAINRLAPELKVVEGDVRKLPFEDGFFNGYWSLGVIEHFPGGYDEILAEMVRVIAPGGFLFITFPHYSPLRRLRSKLGAYPALPAPFDYEANGFYQFALSDLSVINDLAARGFELMKRTAVDGLGGVVDEYPFWEKTVAWLEANAFKNPVVKCVKIFGELAMRPVCGHVAFMVFRKR